MNKLQIICNEGIYSDYFKLLIQGLPYEICITQMQMIDMFLYLYGNLFDEEITYYDHLHGKYLSETADRWIFNLSRTNKYRTGAIMFYFKGFSSPSEEENLIINVFLELENEKSTEYSFKFDYDDILEIYKIFETNSNKCNPF